MNTQPDALRLNNVKTLPNGDTESFDVYITDSVPEMLNALRLADELQAGANARLMAAAPDLLEVAQLFVAWSEAENNHKDTTFWERVEMVRELDQKAKDAIAKATGSAA